MPSIPYLPGATIDFDQNGLMVLRQPMAPIEQGMISPSQFLAGQATDRAVRSREMENRKNLAARTGSGNVPELINAYANSADPYSKITNPQHLPAGMAPRFYRPIVSRELDIPIGEMARETQVSAAVAQEQLASDVAGLERANAAIRQSNDRVLQALKAVTGGDLGEDGAAWKRWWTDREGYALMTTQDTTRPTIVQDVPIGYHPQAAPEIMTGPILGFAMGHSCFAAGTAVRTIDGDRPIESIRAGDLVLVQDTRSGALGYQAVVAAYHNPPSPTLKVKLGEADAVVATGIHRFWKAGKGWTMARDLKPGDLVRTLGGVAGVSAVEHDRTQPVFNLEVAEGHSFLVGKLGALVHDNSLVEATPAPFDAGSKAREVI